MPTHNAITVISGGSAANSLVGVFRELAGDGQCGLGYVMPVSDNGGSSSELIRVFGGPGIGDVRSRLVRLIPEAQRGDFASQDVLEEEEEEEEEGGDVIVASPVAPLTAIRQFFAHRLPAHPSAALLEWHSILSSTHPLWHPIPSETHQLIRSFLLHLNLEITKRTRPPNNIFSFQHASVGNLFLTGARLFTGSFESAIYLMRAIAGVPEYVSVLPAIDSNFSHHIQAGLCDGSVITGQNAISHPSAPTAMPVDEDNMSEDANLPGSLPMLRQQNIVFSKTPAEEDNMDLPARIERIWYINPYGQEIRPAANPKVLDALRKSQCLVYSIGSLYTSIIPCLILRGIGDTIATSHSIRFKVLILNGSIDRETGPPSHPFTALDFIAAIARACAESQGRIGEPVAPEEYRLYVTHVVHLEGEGTPVVDGKALKALGVECLRVYGRRAGGGGMRYDGVALRQVLEAILGRTGGLGRKGRRMTMEQ
ncbi:MAG: hypothetical protein M1839_001037 [Geoglossum umbratile]|nr:MAG: hypothetical protein M1839_001037 [Geoglossum umbratile]